MGADLGDLLAEKNRQGMAGSGYTSGVGPVYGMAISPETSALLPRFSEHLRQFLLREL
jgi:hypothetical protein